MYSKEEALLIKKEFWTAFAEAYPRKWLLYDTKIKDVTLKIKSLNKIIKFIYSSDGVLIETIESKYY
jgi:hypothetical protein